MDEIKQQKIKLNKDQRNSTNNINENDRLNVILSVIDSIYQVFDYKFLSEKRFNDILSTITKAKNDGLKVEMEEKSY